jgi:hypothetical protein
LRATQQLRARRLRGRRRDSVPRSSRAHRRTDQRRMHGRPSTSELFAVTNHTLRASARSAVIAAVPAARDEWSAPRAPVVLARSGRGAPTKRHLAAFPHASCHMPGRHLGHRSPNTANNARSARSARAFAQQAELAPVIAKLHPSGVTTLNGIAAELNARGIPTPGWPTSSERYPNGGSGPA